MRTFEIALFSPPSRMANHYRPPVGLLYIGGYLTRKGYKVKIIDVPIGKQIKNRDFFRKMDSLLKTVENRMIEDYKKNMCDIVGISCYTPEYYEVVSLVKSIKQANPKAKIIIGGIHPTLYPDDFLDEDCGVDFCVIGEGEATMHELCASLLDGTGRPFGEIPGLAFIDKTTGKKVFTPQRQIAENLDDISHPDYSLIDMNHYTNANPYAIRGCFLRCMYLLSTRGCPSQCTFCVAKKLRKFNGGGRTRSAVSLIKELKLLKGKYAVDSFYFIDDLFTIDRENVKTFCSLLKKENLGLIWECSSKVSTLNRELLEIMADSGCVQIDFGVERGSDRALVELKKGITLSKVKEIFSACHELGIRTFANMMVNVPCETEDDLRDILSLLNELKSEIVSINIFTPYPGTEIYDNAGRVFSKDEYALLSKSPGRLYNELPQIFKFASHDIDIERWTSIYNKKYNKILPNLKFYVGKDFLRILLKSGKKINYLTQFRLLAQELINQKFG